MTRPLGRVESWAVHRWIVRRYNHQRGYDYPRWWRARRARRLSLGLPAHVTDPIRADVERPLLIDRLAEMPPRDTTFHIHTDEESWKRASGQDIA